MVLNEKSEDRHIITNHPEADVNVWTKPHGNTFIIAEVFENTTTNVSLVAQDEKSRSPKSVEFQPNAIYPANHGSIVGWIFNLIYDRFGLVAQRLETRGGVHAVDAKITSSNPDC